MNYYSNEIKSGQQGSPSRQTLRHSFSYIINNNVMQEYIQQ